MHTSPAAPDDALKHKSDRRVGEDGHVAVRAVTINKPRQELYAFFRNFSNLPQVMENIERIDELDDRRSHWVVKAPAGQTVEWDSVVVEDDPGRLIAWKTEEGAQAPNHGVVEFRDAPQGRGTEVHAVIVYHPPGGPLGKLVAELFAMEPGMQAKRDLRRFKMLMETGEIATTKAPDCGAPVRQEAPRLRLIRPARKDTPCAPYAGTASTTCASTPCPIPRSSTHTTPSSR